MPTVVDSLVVSLGLDASNFTAGQKQMVVDLRKTETEADRTAKMLQASGKQAAEFFGAIKTQALSLLGVFLGGRGIEEFIRGTASSLTDLRLAARSIGISTQDLQAFEQAIFRMGGQADSARSSLEAMAAAQFNLKTLATDVGFVQFGGKIGERDIANAAPWKIMQEFIAWAATEKDPQQVRYFGGLGHIDPGLVTAILQMNAISNLAAEMRESFRLGNIASQQQVDAAVKFQESVRRFETAVEGLSRSVIPFETMKNTLDGLTRILTKDTSEAQKPGDFNPAMHSGFIGDWATSTLPKTIDDFFAHLDQRVADMYLDRNAADRDLITHLPSYVGPHDNPMLRHMPAAIGPPTGIGPRADPRDPRGIRNNNPLNLEYRPDQGASTSDGRFGIYPTMEAGIAAASRQILMYRDQRGLNTINEIVGRWAPAGENDPLAYARSVAREVGIDPNAQLNLNDPEVMAKLIAAMAHVETGRPFDINVARRALPYSDSHMPSHPLRDIPGGQGDSHVPGGSIQHDIRRWWRSEPDPALIPRKMLRKEDMESRQSVSHNDNSIAVDIGAVHVNTQATDAKGISADIHRQLSEEIAAQAGRGLQ